MPTHNWKRVDLGTFHDFHHAWIEELKRALNAGLLPADYYAMAEQHAAGFGPDVLTLQAPSEDLDEGAGRSGVDGGLLLAPPPKPASAQAELDFYRYKQNVVAVRHASDDLVVAMIEVVSPGNKRGAGAMHSFVDKALRVLHGGLHLLILDLHMPGPRDPMGVHGAIWEELTDERYVLPTDKPLTAVSYESGGAIRAYVEHFAVGDALQDMPLFLLPDRQVPVPLERTYNAAFAAIPRRWQTVLEREDRPS